MSYICIIYIHPFHPILCDSRIALIALRLTTHMKTRGRTASEDVSAVPAPKRVKEAVVVGDGENEFDIDREEIERMAAVMGIASFGSSKGKDHSASDASGVKKVNKRKSKQVIRESRGDGWKPSSR